MSENDKNVPSIVSDFNTKWGKRDILNPIRPGGGGSEAQMAKLTAASQKPLIL